MTRLLARMQTAIVGPGIRAMGGDLDRFVIFTLVARQSLGGELSDAGLANATPITMNALSASLARPYETVRRQVMALVEQGLCIRTPNGVVGAPLLLRHPLIPELIAIAHDSFVRFVEDMVVLGVPLPRQRPDTRYALVSGFQAATDLMLAVTHANRDTHGDWAELAVFSMVLAANTQSFVCDPERAWLYADQTRPAPVQLLEPIRPSALAQVLEMPESTVRRKVAALIADGRLIRVRNGVLVSDAWMNLDSSIATSTESWHNIRRILERVAAQGFPFDAPQSAYIAGRPPEPAFERRPATVREFA
ncbi:hypothetical protein ACG3SL_11155 [Sphingomonas sp. CJ20]